MVAHDAEFKKDLTKLSDKELSEFRKTHVSNLFNGYKGSIDNVEREALIREADIEIEMRFKKKAETRSNIALLVSVIALILSLFSLLLKYL